LLENASGARVHVDSLHVDLTEPGLIAHGPVTLSVDEGAARSYSRASAATRRLSEWWPSISRAL
jgi:hypothetical protein